MLSFGQTFFITNTGFMRISLDKSAKNKKKRKQKKIKSKIERFLFQIIFLWFRNLKRFVDGKMDLILNRFVASEFDIMQSIFVAVRNNHENAKALLGDESIDRLAQLSYAVPYARLSITNSTFGSDYEACKELLKFKNPIRT